MTAKVWLPSASGPYVAGLVQAVAAAASSLHAKVEPAFVEAKVNVALARLTIAGSAEVIDTTGATVSIVQPDDAGEETFPAGSVAVTAKVWRPSASGPYVAGLVHGAVAAPSSEQENVEAASVEEKPNDAPVWLVTAAGADVIDTTGAVMSIVQVNDAGAERLPAGPVAVTVKEWFPEARAA